MRKKKFCSLKIQNFTSQPCQILFPGKKISDPNNEKKFSRNKRLPPRLTYKHKTVGKSNEAAVHVKQFAVFSWSNAWNPTDT